MAKKLFVGGLPYSVDSAKLEEIFSKAGKVLSSNVISDKFTGQSRGFGFVEMEDEEASKAIQELNETEIEGRKITVNEAKPIEERGRSRPNFDRNRGFGGGRNNPRERNY